ncbi:MAG: hypothetical protein BMS9Abin37_1891 [Acidobacteriota bacterium]|nr:MAG: hypothetical protein BMS9Abin37_1891 [Acidobacteriota bacterium]
MTEIGKRSTRGVQVLLWGVRIATAGLLGHAALGKFTGTEHALEMFSRLGLGASGRIFIGMIEMLAALLILSPQSTVYGAFLGLGVMIGAIIAHLTMIGLEGLAHATLVAVGCVTLLYICRQDASFLRNLWDR